MSAIASHNKSLNIFGAILAAHIMAIGSGNGRTLEPTVIQNDRVVISQRVIVLRRGAKGRDYKEAIIKIPEISGIGDADILRKVRSIIDLKNIFGESLEEIRSDFKDSSWLSGITYKVNYNANSIVDITFFQSGVGAYPDTVTENRVINLKTGAGLTATDVFNATALGAIAQLVDGAMHAEVKRYIKKYGGDEFANDRLIQELDKQFKVEDLDRFSVSGKGITFLYDFGFPHATRALEPSGRYFFRYETLRTHIKPDGPFGVFLK